jgi:TctA family transporter
MDFISNLGLGLAVALTLQNAAYCFIGVLLGTVIGVLPGIGPVTTVAMLLPISFTLQPEAALIMLAGIYYGAQYGGSTTAILVNIPGEASSVVTTIDGHQMARQGRAGPALGIAALGSFFAGCVSTLLIALAAPPLASIALQFGPAEYFSLMVCGLIAAVVLARGSLLKAVAMVVLGLLLGLVGTDVNSGARRFNFGMTGLADGIEFVAISMAIYGIAEVVYNLEKQQTTSVVADAVGRVWPSLTDLKQCAGSILRGTALGAILGVLPGGGALLASFAAYTLEKKVASAPRQFGNGDIRGVAAPESANNAGAQTSFIPMLTLGIPGNPTMAMMIGALMIHGIAPGPRVMTDRPGLFWGLIASMWLGNLMLVVLNLPMVGVWVRLLRVPYRLLYPAIIAFCCIGAYTINNKPFDAFVMAFFAVFGYVALKLDWSRRRSFSVLCWGR